MKLRPHCHTAIFTAPTFVAAGTVSAGATNATPGIPAGATTNDILLYIVCNSGSLQTFPSGYTSLGNANGSTTETRILWKRHSGSESAQLSSITPATAGIIARMLAFRGCVLTGTPVDQSALSVDNTNQTSLTCPAITSIYPNTMLINAIGEALSTSIGTTEFSGYVNANLTGLTEAIDNTNTAGTGVGIGASYGVLPMLGSSGATTVTAATSKNHQFVTCNLIGQAS